MAWCASSTSRKRVVVGVKLVEPTVPKNLGREGLDTGKHNAGLASCLGLRLLDGWHHTQRLHDPSLWLLDQLGAVGHKHGTLA